MTGRSGAHSSFILHPASLGEEVPASITAVLIARLDRLPAPLKAVVQTAAVLGHEFDVQVLDRMLAGDTAVHAKVRGAEDEAIWSALSDTRYRFRHALLRDAAYEMQVRARLRDLHARAGAAIEQTYGEVLAPHISDLVYHYGQAGDAGRERRYLALLGEQAFNVSAFREALACFARALDLALGEADPAAPAQRARLIAQLARTHLMLGDDDEAQRLYEECLGLAEAAGDQSSAAAACFELGALAYRHAAFADALAALHRSLALYRAAGDRAGEGRALNQLGGLYIELGDADTALACYEQALSLGRKHGARVS